MKSSPPAVLLFDLGGVLVHWIGLERIGALLPRPMEESEIRRAWGECTWAGRFELGRCSPAEFAAGVVADLGLALSPEDFLEVFTSWVPGPIDGALELLDGPAAPYRRACLSNTNAVHWSRIRDEFGLGARFERHYLSFELGLAKPDERIFEHVLSDLAQPPSAVAFFDDSPECVDAAERLGMRANLVRGPAEVRTVLAAP